MLPAEFRQRIAELSARLAGRPPDAELDAWLNRERGPGSATHGLLRTSCPIGVAEGWLCDREGDGLRYGRIFKPAADLHDFPVDVVDMKGIAGPHHAHPDGDIALIMPIDAEARFDGRLAGPPARQRALADGRRRPRAGALPAAERPHRLLQVSPLP